jgi:hypothetical protein
VLYGRADEDAIAPYQPFAEALRPYLAERSREELRGLPLAAELGRLVPDQADRLPALGAAATRDPGGERYRLFEAAASLLASAAALQAVLLVLDDLHWADRPTLLLLRHLARAPLGPVLILGTARTDERAPALGALLTDLGRDGLVQRMALEGLGQRDVDALITAWLGADAPGSLTGSVWSETGGNPFFVEEVLRQVWESGAPGVPEGVREMLARRLERLGEPAGDVVRLAAVAGGELRLDVLEAAGELPRAALVEALDAALAAHLIREEPAGAVFAHALVREAIYAQLSARGARCSTHGSARRSSARAARTPSSRITSGWRVALPRRWSTTRRAPRAPPRAGWPTRTPLGTSGERWRRRGTPRRMRRAKEATGAGRPASGGRSCCSGSATRTCGSATWRPRERASRRPPRRRATRSGSRTRRSGAAASRRRCWATTPRRSSCSSARWPASANASRRCARACWAGWRSSCITRRRSRGAKS